MALAWIILAQFVCVQLASGSTVNVARGKPVNVSSRFFGRDPSIAVDGDTRAVDLLPNNGGYGVIVTALNQPDAWWWVDLQTRVQDATVKIYFRTDHKRRRNGVRLYTSTTSFNTYPSGNPCYNVTGRADGTDILDIVSVTCSGTWRYLMVYTDTDNSGKGEGPVLDFGEVEVLACAIGTYGANCMMSCGHCSVSSPQCDRYTGVCPGGCEPGWLEPNCTQACTNSMYGPGCNSYCANRHCSNSSSCNHITGQCDNGCQAGWTGLDCLQGCSQLEYGVNCAKSCSSRRCAVPPTSTSCDRFTGTCPGGCKPGYRLPDCAEVCVSNMYGPECSLSCGDRHCRLPSVCHPETGQCNSGCNPGWNGTDCIQECPAGTYGNNCSQLCSDRHCMTSSDTCDHVNGTCPSGCQAGWNGTDCKLQCLTGTYGANCVKSCSDRQCRTQSSSCDRVTGQCFDGCQGGWNGQDCTNQCPTGTFGHGCWSCNIRHCKGASDCPEDGTCSGGCQDGWTLDKCTQACPSGTYGPYCSHSCGNCTGDNICNHVTGNCPGDCKAGWRGSQCKQTCPSETYGVNCMETCGHCIDICDVVDGNCQGGCEDGYGGAQCHLRLISDTGVDCVSSAVIGAVIGAFVMFVVIGGVHFCLLRHGRLQWMKSSRPKDSTQPREMTNIARPHDISHGVAQPSLSGSSHTYNNDYAVLDTSTISDNKDYDVIKNKMYENL